MASNRPNMARTLAATLLTFTPLTLGGCGQKGNPIANAFEDMFPPSPGEVARQAFDVYDADNRRNSVAMLSAARFGGEEPYLRTYRLLIDDPDASVRAACVQALGLHGTVEDVKLIAPRLEDQAAYVRWEAAVALQKIHSNDAIDPLLSALAKDSDADVRQASAAALGQYAQVRVFNALVAALDDPNFGVAAAAQRSLHLLTGQKLGSDSLAWMEWSHDRPAAELFAHQQAYTWQPFKRPRTTLEKAQFWKADTPKPPRPPTGADYDGES